MRIQWPVLALPVIMACGGSPPASPTEPAPASPAFSIRFVLTNPASLRVSEPVPCPGDWSTCPRGSQPLGDATTSAVTIRDYTLAPGTHRLTGILQPGTTSGASVHIQISGGPTGSIGGGVAREGPVLGVFGYTGDPLPRPPSIDSLVCGATFSTPTGALEWSVSFRVIAIQPRSPEPLCL